MPRYYSSVVLPKVQMDELQKTIDALSRMAQPATGGKREVALVSKKVSYLPNPYVRLRISYTWEEEGESFESIYYASGELIKENTVIFHVGRMLNTVESFEKHRELMGYGDIALFRKDEGAAYQLGMQMEEEDYNRLKDSCAISGTD